MLSIGKIDDFTGKHCNLRLDYAFNLAKERNFVFLTI